MVLNIAIVVLVYDQASRDQRGFERTLNFALIAGAVFSALGLMTLILFQLGINALSPLIEFRSLGDWTIAGGMTLVPRPIIFEPNVASYLGALGLFALGISLASRGRRAVTYALQAVLLFAGDAVAYSRGAWLGTIAGGLVLASLAIARPGWANIRPQRIVVALVLVGVTVALVSTLVPSVEDVIIGRGANLLNIQQGTAFDRLSNWQVLFTDGLNQPIFGHGADSYKALIPAREVAENASVEIFHASGIVGLAFYFSANLVVLVVLARALFESRSTASRAVAASALASFGALLISSQMNPSMWGNMYWLLIGIFLASAVTQPSPAPSRADVMGRRQDQTLPPRLSNTSPRLHKMTEP
jgi:hypothetical protein